MKICHLTSIHKRYDIRIFQKQCTSLAKLDYEVYLVVNDKLSNEKIRDVNIISTGIRYKNRIHRFIHSNRKLYSKSVQINADVYHLHDPDLISVGKKLKKKGFKVVFDSHEDIPTQIYEKNWIPKILRGFLSKLYANYEKRNLTRFDALITVTPHILERLSLINSNIFLITNYPILNNITKKVPRNSDDMKIKLCFAGGINSTWNHELILSAIDQLDDIEYFMAGPVEEKYLKKLKRNKGWEKTHYLGIISKREVEELLSESDIGLALNYSKQVIGTGTLGNNKLFEFMEASIPVICSNYEIWKNIVFENECGLCVNPNNLDEIVFAIKHLVSNKNERVLMGKNGRLAVENQYNWSSEESKLYELYKRLLNQKG